MIVFMTVKVKEALLWIHIKIHIETLLLYTFVQWGNV